MANQASVQYPRQSKMYLLQISDQAIRDQVQKMVGEKKRKSEKPKQNCFMRDDGDNLRASYPQKKKYSNQQFFTVKHSENYTATPLRNTEKICNTKSRGPSPDRRSLNYDEMKKLKERYTFVGRSLVQYSDEKNKKQAIKNGKFDGRNDKKYEKMDPISPNRSTQKKVISYKEHSSDNSQDSSKDSGISGSTKTDIDLMKGIYSNDDESELEKAEKMDTVGSPPARRRAIVRTINNDAKLPNRTEPSPNHSHFILSYDCALLKLPKKSSRNAGNEELEHQSEKQVPEPIYLPDTTHTNSENKQTFVNSLDDYTNNYSNHCYNNVSVIEKGCDCRQNSELHLEHNLLTAFGETEKTTRHGPKIHENLAKLLLPILLNGMKKDTRINLSQEYLIPKNCPLLQAPKLNREISAAITDFARIRDRKREMAQQQLGIGITAICKGLELLLDSGTDRLLAIKYLSDSCRLLCDLHHTETRARRNAICMKFEKSVQNYILEGERDDTLFGKRVADRIKKNGLQLKACPSPKVLRTIFTSPKRTMSQTSRIRRRRSPARSTTDKPEYTGKRPKRYFSPPRIRSAGYLHPKSPK